MYTPGVWLGSSKEIFAEQVSVLRALLGVAMHCALCFCCSCIPEAADAAAEQLKAL